MGNRILKVMGTVAMFAASGFAQNIVGSWQGAMVNPQGQEMKVVVKIARADDESFKATLHRVDLPSQPINASSVALQGANLKLGIASLAATFEGKVSADGNTIAGTFTQNAPLALNLVRETPQTAWAIPDPPAPQKPMAADVDPGFEVATIKPSDPNKTGRSITVGRGGIFTTVNTTLNDLLIFTYALHPKQLSGGPGWMETEKFDITAQPDHEGIPSAVQLRSMAKKLLTERFALTFHREKKELSAYTINIGKTGPKLAKSDAGGILPGFSGRGPGSVAVRNSSMTEFAEFLQARIVDRPVVDQTGLAGRFDFTLVWRPDEPATPQANAPAPPADLESRADLFTSMQEQLGLKFEPAKVPVEVLVIDRVSKPSEN